MAGDINYLMSLLAQPPAQTIPNQGSIIAPSQSAVPPILTQGTSAPVQDSNAPTNLSGVDVVAPRKPPISFDNSVAQGHLNDAMNQEYSNQQTENQQPGARPGPTSYGILPANMQHGALSKILGLLGDAYLVHHGRAPAYLQGQQNLAEGNAMAGLDLSKPNSVAAAAERVAATGVPGAPELSDKIFSQGEQAALRQQYMQYNQDYRQSRIDAMNDSNLQRAAPAAQLLMRGADPTGKDWDARTAQVDKMLARYGTDPSTGRPFDHTSIGVPDQYDPTFGLSGGETGGQIGRDTNAAGTQATSRRDTDVTASSRLGAASINAGGHVAAARIGAAARGTSPLTTIFDKIKNGTATDMEKAYANSIINGKKANRGLAPNLTPNNSSQGNQQQFVNGQVYQDQHGNKAMYQNGKWIPR